MANKYPKAGERGSLWRELGSIDTVNKFGVTERVVYMTRLDAESFRAFGQQLRALCPPMDDDECQCDECQGVYGEDADHAFETPEGRAMHDAFCGCGLRFNGTETLS